MTTKPATPLPWKTDNLSWALKTNAAYIVHACNNYPRLVSVMRDVAAGKAPAYAMNNLLRELGEL